MAGQQLKSFPIYIRTVEVAEAYDVTPNMRRVVFTGEEFDRFVADTGHETGAFFTDNADDHVKLVLPGRDGTMPPRATQDDGHVDWPRETIASARDYTPRRWDPAQRRLEIDFVRHQGGRASEWADAARPGDRVQMAGPRGTTVPPDDADWHLLVGDETALPAIARRLEELPAGRRATAVIGVPTAADEQEISHDPGLDLDLVWVHHDEAGPDGVFEALRQVAWREGVVDAFAAGEADMLRPIRRWLRHDKKVPKTHLNISGYWRAGQTQTELGSALHDLQHAADLAVPYALRAAVTLRLTENIGRGGTTLARLAEATGTHLRGLRKILTLLQHAGYFTLTPQGRVTVTPRGSLLAEDLVHQALDASSGMATLDRSWPGLIHALRTESSGYARATGETFWETLAGDSALQSSFDSAMAMDSARWIPPLVARLDLDREVVVDLGGGDGSLLTAVLSSAPNTSGVLVEQATTLEAARASIDSRGLTDRVRLVEGSFFDALPEDGDLYLLTRILHDWPDREASAILQRVADVIGSGRLLVLEQLEGPHQEDHDVSFDLRMYATFGSGERTEEEYRRLGDDAGLRLVATTSIAPASYLLEFVRA